MGLCLPIGLREIGNAVAFTSENPVGFGAIVCGNGGCAVDVTLTDPTSYRICNLPK